jgi:Tfp pilus assembly protein PilZ
VSPLRDLSSGGARFLSDYRFATGSILEIQLLLLGSTQPVSLKARVAWSKPARLKITELGVTFDPGDTAIQQRIDAAVAHFLSRRKER